MIRLLSALSVRGILFLCFLSIFVWQFNLLHTQPTRFYPTQIEIALQPSETVVLGKQMLAAPYADNQHALFKRNEAGAWQIANVSQNKKIEISRHEQDMVLRSLILKSGMVVSLKDARLVVDEVSANRIEFRWMASGTPRKFSYDGTQLSAEPRIEHCHDRPLAQSMRLAWNDYMPYPLRVNLPVFIGGVVSCDQQIAMPTLTKAGMSIALNDGHQFVLRTHSSQVGVCEQSDDARCTRSVSLFELAEPLQGVDTMVIGRTHYQVEVEGDTLRLHPVKGAALLNSPPQVDMPNVHWQVHAFQFWKWPAQISGLWLLLLGASLVAAILLCMGIVNWLFPFQSKWAGFGLSVGLLLLVSSMLLYQAKAHFGIGWLMVMFTCIQCFCLLLPLSLTSMFSLGIALVLSQVGLMTLLTLGVCGGDVDSFRFFQSNGLIFCMGFSLVIVISFKAQLSNKVSLLKLEGGLLVLTCFALIALAIQFVMGDEAGVLGVQPVEIAKLALLLLVAHVFAIRFDWQSASNIKHWLSLWFIFLLPVMMFLALATISLVMVHDFSPFLLIIALIGSVFLAWLIATGHVVAILVMVSLMMVLKMFLPVGVDGMASALAEWIPYSDRVDVWLSPHLHPHTGAQVYQAGKLIQQGGLLGQSNAFGWAVPAVQDDFAPSWFMARFGATGAALLILLQTLHLCSLLALGWQYLNNEAGDFRAMWQARFKFFALWGAAGLLCMHDCISWGTNLGWLPVMGQPMPFVSYGGSMILFLLIPIQMLALQNSPRS